MTSPAAPVHEPLAVPPVPAMMPPSEPSQPEVHQPAWQQPMQHSAQPPVAEPVQQPAAWSAVDPMHGALLQPAAHAPVQMPAHDLAYAGGMESAHNASTQLPPRRPPGHSPAPLGGSLLNQGASPAAAGFGQASAVPQWSLPSGSQPAPYASPHRESDDPMTTILRGTGGAPGGEVAMPAVSVPSVPTPVTMPRQAMEVQLGGSRRRPGKRAALIAALLMVSALGAAGWMFREPVTEVVQRYLRSKKPAGDGDVKLETETVVPPVGNVASGTPEEQRKPAIFDPLSKSPDGVVSSRPAANVDGKQEPVSPAEIRRPGSTILSPKPDGVAGMTSGGGGSTTAAPAASPVAPRAMIVDDAEHDATGAQPRSQHVPGTAMGTVPKPTAVDEAGPEAGVQTTTKSPPTTSTVQHAEPASSALTPDVPADVIPAVTALKAFFAARNLEERLPLTLGGPGIRSLMERYYAKADAGPVNVDEIRLLRYDPKPETGGGPHCVFTVASRQWDYPIPVMLQQDHGAFRVDWLTFVEFRDNLLYQFLNDFQEMPARFHVGIRRTHYFDDDVPDLDAKDSFEIQPPQPGWVGYTHVPKNTPLASDLASRIGWDTMAAYVVVELRWKRLGEMKWVELVGVPQLNWYSLPVPVAQQDSSKPGTGKSPSKGVDIKKSKKSK